MHRGKPRLRESPGRTGNDRRGTGNNRDDTGNNRYVTEAPPGHTYPGRATSTPR
ncbi:hypothetical protein DPMN_132075 [Dreissena polymorpha]|uniref:Uncharacterized protein n=1 Tax=Dreissena polymorpha TaxID=45954 RepID=A0A9D4FXM4_DREPO|nr:hypothetical protein DPMN_132075 [Dreissena polymorpha]